MITSARLDGVQVLRGVAAVLVLLFHAAGFEINHPMGREVQALGSFQFHGFAGVVLFFVISGFVITWISLDSVGNARAIPGFVVKRFNRVMPFYWMCWALAAFIQFGVARDDLSIPPESILPHSIENLLLTTRGGYYILPQAWTLHFEIIFYAIFAVLLAAPRVLVLPALTLWACLIVAAWIGYVPSISALAPYCLLFVAGCGVAMLAKRRLVFMPRVSALAGLLGWALAAALVAMGLIDRHNQMIETIAFGLPSALLVYGVVGLDLKSQIRWPSSLVKLGDASFTLYLSHLTVLFVLGRWAVAADDLPRYAVWLAAAVALPVHVAFLLHKYVEKPLLVLLNGSRHARNPHAGLVDGRGNIGS